MPPHYHGTLRDRFALKFHAVMLAARRGSRRARREPTEDTRRGDKNMSEGQVTTDHDTIRHWAEERGAVPATVKSTETKGEPGILRLDFAPRDKSLDPISWEAFFEKFDHEHLAFLYQDGMNDGSISRFHKFINR
jgi:hypothetical protein